MPGARRVLTLSGNPGCAGARGPEVGQRIVSTDGDRDQVVYNRYRWQTSAMDADAAISREHGPQGLLASVHREADVGGTGGSGARTRSVGRSRGRGGSISQGSCCP
jgi:hypothetical protein